MVGNFKKLPKELQKVATSAFSKFDYQTVQSLLNTDLRITFAKPELDDVAGGRFNETRNTIELYVDPQNTKHAEAYLIHEMVHAVDRLKHKTGAGLVQKLMTPAADSFASRQDPELRRLHQEYAKRSLPGVGQQLADFARAHPQTGGKPLLAGARSYDWQIDDDQLKLKERDRGLRLMESTIPTATGGVVSTALGLAALTIGISAGATLVGGAVALPLMAFGLSRLGATATAVKDERALVGHKDDMVQVRDGEMTFKIDQSLPESAQPTTAYATLSRRPEEYLAESMTEFLRSQETRESLQRRDPEMYEYCKGWNIAAD